MGYQNIRLFFILSTLFCLKAYILPVNLCKEYNQLKICHLNNALEETFAELQEFLNEGLFYHCFLSYSIS